MSDMPVFYKFNIFKFLNLFIINENFSNQESLKYWLLDKLIFLIFYEIKERVFNIA